MDQRSDQTERILDFSEDLSVVIPVYNEGPNAERLFTELAQSPVKNCEILICYDMDEDSTLPYIDKFKEQLPRMRGEKNKFGRGVLGAIKSGLGSARGLAVLVMMADLSDDLSSIPPMMDEFENGAHVVAGSRYMKGGQQIGGPAFKKFLSRMAGVSLYYLAGVPTHDISNSFRLYSKELLNQVEIESTGGFELGMELTVKAHRLGLKVAEVPTVWRDRADGESRFKLVEWLPKYLRWYRLALLNC